MKRITLLAVIAAGLAFGTLTSCSKEESKTSSSNTTTDARDLAVGTYTGIAVSTIDGDVSTDTTTFTVSKGTGTTLNITEDGLTFATSSVAVAGKDFAGNIPTQMLEFDGANFTITGKGSNNQHFAFVESRKSFSYEIQINGGPLSGSSVSVVGTKK